MKFTSHREKKTNDPNHQPANIIQPPDHWFPQRFLRQPHGIIRNKRHTTGEAWMPSSTRPKAPEVWLLFQSDMVPWWLKNHGFNHAVTSNNPISLNHYIWKYHIFMGNTFMGIYQFFNKNGMNMVYICFILAIIMAITCNYIWFICNLVGGWPTPLKNMNVSWDDDIPNIWKNKSHVPNHQPAMAFEAAIMMMVEPAEPASWGIRKVILMGMNRSNAIS